MIRKYTQSDYGAVSSFWGSFGCAVIPESMLPSNGLVVEEDGKIMSAGWLCVEQGGAMAYIGWVVSNPDNTPRQSYDSLLLILSSFLDFCDGNDISMTANTASSGLQKIYNRLGFKVSEDKTTTFVRI